MDQHVLSQTVEYLTVLDLERSSTLADVRRAYRLQAQTWNPNGLPEARLRKEAERRQADARRAYNWLMQHAEALRELAERSDQVDDGHQGSTADESTASWLHRRLEVIAIPPVVAASGVLYLLLVGMLLNNIVRTYASNRESIIGPLNVIAADGGDTDNREEILTRDRALPHRSETRSELESPPAESPSAAEPTVRDDEDASRPSTGLGADVGTVQAGASKTDVSRLLGAPISIERRSVHRQELWYYADLVVTFSADTDIVVRLDQTDAENNRGAESGPGAAETWSIGSHKNDVARIQGSPTRIERLREAGQEVWHFGESTVIFAIDTDRVTAWDDSGRNLKASPADD